MAEASLSESLHSRKSTGISFLGAGNHAHHHMKEFARLPGVRLTAVYDVDSERARLAAQDFPPLRAVNSLEALLHGPELSAVVIATPAESHRELVEAVLFAGKHALLEKPIAPTPQEARAIVEASEAHPQQVLLVGHCERFNPAYMDAHKAIQEGHVGQPRFISVSRISPLHLNDPTWKLGVLDTAVHDIDLALWLMGARPVAVAASGTNANPELSLLDHVTYQIYFDNGALAQGYIGWIPFSGGYPMRNNAHPRLFLAGTEGVINLDLWQRPVAVHSTKTGAYFWPDNVLVGYSDYFTEVSAQNYAFLRAVSDGIPLPMKPWEAYVAACVAHAAQASLQSGGVRVALDEDSL